MLFAVLALVLASIFVRLRRGGGERTAERSRDLVAAEPSPGAGREAAEGMRSGAPVVCPANMRGRDIHAAVQVARVAFAKMALSTHTPEEMVQQMKELITESSELKEAMKLHNQAMKDWYEELSICREKQKEEREFHELKFKEVKQCSLDKCMENEKLQQHLQNLKEREGAEMEGCMAPEKEMRQLISQVQRLQAEKANMLGIISELQVKLNISAEDSFVETGMNEGEINRTAKEHQENSGEMTSNVDIYGRSKTADESKNLQSEELIVSQLLYCLRNESQKREELEKELQNHKERLSKLEKKTSNCLKSGTQTEQQAEESSEAVGSEVETLSLQVCALFQELQEAHEKVKEAELIQKKLQEKCQVLERKSSAAASELEEKQQLIYTIKKLELQVESVQAEVKLEQAKAHEEKARYSSLQDTNSKLLPELTKAMKAMDEMKLKELHRADKVVVEQLNAKVELAEQAPAAKQLQIDEMKQIIANYLLLTLTQGQELGDCLCFCISLFLPFGTDRGLKPWILRLKSDNIPTDLVKRLHAPHWTPRLVV
ncbi:optineurin-like [Chlamydotis macqueenii]